MKKKLLIVIAALLLISLALGCSAQKPDENIKTATINSSAAKAENGDEKNSLSTSKADTKSTENADKSTTKADKTAKDKTQNSAKASTTKKNETAKPSKKASTKKEKVKSVCYITIECKTILDNMDKLSDGHESFVPSNGIILKKTECEIKKGSTVYDILEYACNNNGIKLTSRDTIYGIYVSGINNLDEFDCGSASGWVYTVNSQSPTKSCNKYTVSNGDEIVFKYVC